MIPLILRHISSTHEHSVDSDPLSTTLLELRYQLFSLTDIPPDQLVLTIGTTQFIPDDDADATRTLSSLGIQPGATLLYENSQNSTSELQQAPEQQRQEIDVSALQAALATVSSRSAPVAPLATATANEGASVRAATKQFMSRVEEYHKAVCEYEDVGLQTKARKVAPIDELKGKAEARLQNNDKEYPTYELALAKELLIWFKESFFTWMNAPECWSCGSETAMVGMAPPTEHELKHRASRVEQHDCKKCGASTRFPRYSDAGKLLETRKGRCGEWAQAFTLIARAAGLKARAVHDWTDHVWTEIYTPVGDNGGRWVHADSCENVLDEPLLYEKGWGKKLNYCVATGVDCVMDVTRRYTVDFESLCPRRTLASEAELQRTLGAMNARVIADLPGAEQDPAIQRYVLDAGQIGMPRESFVNLPGRQSGSEAWIKARGEDGPSK